MVITWLVPLCVAVALVVALIEVLHRRRVRRCVPFLRGYQLQGWTSFTPVLHGVAWGLGLWGAIILWHIGDQRTEVDQASPRLVVAIDVSPSMHVSDAGPLGQQTRAHRARDLMRDLLAHMEPHRVSVLAFYTDAKMVVSDAVDPAIVDNILDDLPLEHAFSPGRTDVYAVLQELTDISRDWPAQSTRLVVLSDGDSVPARTPKAVGRAFRDVLVLGVGDPTRGTLVGGVSSRQSVDHLRKFAHLLGGRYVDSNRSRVPQGLIPAAMAVRRDQLQELQQQAQIALFVAVIIEGFLPFALMATGFGRKPQPQEVFA